MAECNVTFAEEIFLAKAKADGTLQHVRRTSNFIDKTLFAVGVIEGIFEDKRLPRFLAEDTSTNVIPLRRPIPPDIA